ncbi:hypothetical protein, partial [Bradyrhizobium brasilense]|uniref:hypothetical protein n=1 Tax=Bradyrhizobium brasilense TaxID=1419277 RepID=UPI0032219DB5
MVEHGMAAMSDSTQTISSGSTQSMPVAADEDVPVVEAPSVQAAMTEGTLVVQTLERPLRPGEVSLDEPARPFREAETEVAA